MDGSNSAKWVDGLGHTDERVFRSDYHILCEVVDHFKDDVAHRLKQHTAAQPQSAADRSKLETCTENWKTVNTQQDSMVKVFKQTGIFISACRHGIVESFCEMYCSGELYIRV